MKVITIGRSSQNDISVNDPKVSRHHCQIVQYDNGTFGIVDFGSKNGTFVNGQRVYGEVQLMWGDRVQIAQANLPWQQYFSAGTAKRKNRWLWPTMVGVAAMTVLVVVAIFMIKSNSDKAFPFEGIYPEVVEVELVNDKGYQYTVEAIEGQVCVWFNDISVKDAQKGIKHLGGEIIAQIPDIGYYLVKVPANDVQNFLTKVHNVSGIERVFPNMASYPCMANTYILDNYYPDMSQEDTTPHGVIVQYALQEYGIESPLKPYNIGSTDGKYMCTSDRKSESCVNNAVFALDSIASSSVDNQPIIINMSFGPYLRPRKNGERYYWDSATDEEQLDYQERFKNHIQNVIRIVKPLEGKDFIVTKSAGNNGVKVYDAAIISYLEKNLSPEEKEVLYKHFLLVTAGEKEKNDKEYSNEMEKGHYHPWVTQVDISDFKYNGKKIRGTSIAAPRAAGFISSVANNHDMKVTDVLQYVRKATEKAPDHILTLERLEKEIAGEPNNAKLSENEAVIEGVLKMYLLDNMSDGSTTYYTDTEGNVEYVSVEEKGSYSQVINKYRNTSENEYIAFVVETDNKIDVKQYLSDDDLELFDKTVQSEFMVVPNFQFSGENFAAKYANKRVRVKGTLYVPMAGWRNATDVVMNLSEIMLVDNSEKKTTKTEKNIVSSSHQGIPSSLVGTMWVTNQTHNNWTGEKRTIEFVGEYQVRITDEVLFYLMSTSDNLPEPTVRLYNCYYDAKEDRIFICKNSNQVISNMTMRLKYERGQLIETTNKYSMVEYDRLR